MGALLAGAALGVAVVVVASAVGPHRTSRARLAWGFGRLHIGDSPAVVRGLMGKPDRASSQRVSGLSLVSADDRFRLTSPPPPSLHTSWYFGGVYELHFVDGRLYTKLHFGSKP